ncbi:hypothetical protein Prudu_007491 [Prunus dulcis]|uniref:Uncharacterized protein n=1 Tax=Prunus dulcis TaxID=3755 RepID=A0A4Y1R218_PRUDU|nr:hypothetical protein Prudu_007491 [Prunus dulcis]
MVKVDDDARNLLQQMGSKGRRLLALFQSNINICPMVEEADTDGANAAPFVLQNTIFRLISSCTGRPVLCSIGASVGIDIIKAELWLSSICDIDVLRFGHFGKLVVVGTELMDLY